MATMGRMNMTLEWVLVIVAYIDNMMAISIDLLRMADAILHTWTVRNLHHSNPFGLNWFFSALNVFIVTVYQEIWTVLLTSMIVWIPESTTWSSEVTVTHHIGHFICCNVVWYLLQKGKYTRVKIYHVFLLFLGEGEMIVIEHQWSI